MRENYTFSRALHLMRYSRTKMRHMAYPQGMFIFYDAISQCLMLHFPSGAETVAQLDGFEMAGSFTVYIPELDGAK